MVSVKDRVMLRVKASHAIWVGKFYSCAAKAVICKILNYELNNNELKLSFIVTESDNTAWHACIGSGSYGWQYAMLALLNCCLLSTQNEILNCCLSSRTSICIVCIIFRCYRDTSPPES